MVHSFGENFGEDNLPRVSVIHFLDKRRNAVEIFFNSRRNKQFLPPKRIIFTEANPVVDRPTRNSQVARLPMHITLLLYR